MEGGARPSSFGAPPRKRRRRKKERVPGEPVPARSAYNFFFKDEQERLSLLGSAGAPHSRFQHMATIGENWKNLDATRRQMYQQLASDDKKRFALELVKWKQEQELKEKDSDIEYGHLNGQVHSKRDFTETHQSQNSLPQIDTGMTKATRFESSFALGRIQLRRTFPVDMMAVDELQPTRIFPQTAGFAGCGLLQAEASSREFESTIRLPTFPREDRSVSMAAGLGHKLVGKANVPELNMLEIRYTQSLGRRSPNEKEHNRVPTPGTIAWMFHELEPIEADAVIRIFLL